MTGNNRHNASGRSEKIPDPQGLVLQHGLGRGVHTGWSDDYCWPCAKRFKHWLDFLVKIGVMDADRRETWQVGLDCCESDHTLPSCRHCGRALTYTATEEGLTDDIEHYEACDDRELLTQEPRGLDWTGCGLSGAT